MIKKFLGVLMVVVMVLSMAGAALADPVTMTGTIIEAGDNYVLDTGDKQIILDGDIEEDMVNQQVTVTGEMAVDENGKDIMAVDTIEVQ